MVNAVTAEKKARSVQVERSGARLVSTYTFPDGPNCTVVIPAPVANQTPASALNFQLPSISPMKTKINSAVSGSTVNSQATVASSTPPKDYSDLRSGVKKKEAIDIVHAYQFPNRPFTIKEVLLGTGINHWYVSSYIKSHSKIVGDAPKSPGVRGKVAKLYQLEVKA